MTRTEYFLGRLIYVCGEMVVYGSQCRDGWKDAPGFLQRAVTDFTAAITALNQEEFFGLARETEFEQAVLEVKKALERNYEIIQARGRDQEKVYQLKPSPLTDLSKFHEDLRKQFPEIAKRKALRVYESEKTDPLMDLLNSYMVGLKEVKT